MEALLGLVGFVLGWLVGSIQTREPLIRKVKELQSAPMERVLMLEQRVRDLESELQWKSARVLALESDLDRVNSKLMWRQD